MYVSESRQVVVYVESCGSSPVHSSSNLTVSDSDYRTAIGRISVLHHHKLSDLELLVREAFREYWIALKVFGDSRLVEEGAAANSPPSPKGGLDAGINLWEGCHSLHDRIVRAFSLSKSFVRQEEGNYVNPDVKDAYLRWSEAFLKLSRSRTATMDLSEESILSYRIGTLCWKPGEIPISAKLDTLFNMFCEFERQQGHETCRGSGLPLEKGLIEVTISLKGDLDVLLYVQCMSEICSKVRVMMIVSSHRIPRTKSRPAGL